MAPLQEELAASAANGQHPTTLRNIQAQLAALGYRLYRDGDCWCMAQWKTGARAGQSYPCITARVVETDTGLSFAHVGARRDDNFQKLQEMRLSGEVFAMVRDSIFEI